MAKERLTITKEWLQSLGIEEVTEEGKVYAHGKLVTEHKNLCKHKYGKDKSYPTIIVYDPELYKRKKQEGKIVPGNRYLILSRVVYAWFNGVCPKEYDVDHKDNNPFNNNISNLQLLTRKENLNKHLGRNQHTCHLTDAQLINFNEQKIQYEHMINALRKYIDKEKKEIERLEEELGYFLKTNKDLKLYNVYEEAKENLEKAIEKHKKNLKKQRESWHYWCREYRNFKKSYLRRVKDENE